MRKHAQNGFAHLSLLLLAVVVVVIAFAGYKVAKNNSDNTKANTAGTAASSQAQTIKSKADLSSAEATLNNENIDGDLNPDSLNSDVSSLL